MMSGGTIASTFQYLTLCALALLSTCTIINATPTTNQKIKIQTINYNWVDEEKAEVTACLESEADGTSFGQLDLLVTNALGKAWRVRGGGGGGGASRKTEQGFCFAGLSLGKKDLAKTLSFRVLETGRDEPVLELETFVVVPEVIPMGEGRYKLCWYDPEGLAFALAEGDAARPPAAPSAGCHDCCVYLTSGSPGDLMTLKTAGTKDSIKQLVQFPLPENIMKPHAGLVTLTIKELHKVSREDDPSGRRQNMRVFLDPHEALEADDFKLILTLASGAGQKIYSLFKIIDEDATELEFEGNFKDSIAVAINAMKDEDTVGFGSVAQNLTDPGSRVAKVGDASAPSLRVDPGARDQVDVPGKPPCVRGSGPCYYFGQDVSLDPLCEDLPGIRFCDAVVSEVQNPAEVPALELRNRQELRVQQPRPDVAWTEVVVSSDDSILSPDGFGCDDQGNGTCAQPVDVADDLDGVDVTLVVLDDQGYVTASLAVPFEVHKVSAVALSPSLLKVAVDPRSGGTYEVTLAGDLASPASQECQAGSPCRVWFSGVVAVNDTQAVSVSKDSNTIYEDITTEMPPPASQVQTITSMDAEKKTRVEVMSERSVKKVELVTFESNVAYEDDCEDLETVVEKSLYYFDASARGPGSWSFVLAGYCEDTSFCDVGKANVNLLEMDSRVDAVGAALSSPDASIRLDVGSQESVVVEGFGSCAKADSPCYFLTEGLTEGTLKHCITIPNAEGEGSINQCDTSYTPFKAMTEVPKLELTDGNLLKVSTQTSATLEVLVFNPQTDDLLSVSSPECISEQDGSCSQEVSIPQDLQDFEVLVVALNEDGGVKESVLSPFHDIKVSTRQLTSDMLEVSWTTNQAENYIVSLLSSAVPSSPSSSSSSSSYSPSPSHSSSTSPSSTSSPPSTTPSPPPSSTSPPLFHPSLSSVSSVTEVKRSCTDGLCWVHFNNLEREKTYTVKVQRVGDEKVSAGATTDMNTPADSLPPKCAVTSITATSRSVTQIKVDLSAFASEATSAHLDLQLEGEATELGWEAVPVPESPKGTFEVTHEGQDFPVGSKVLLVFTAEGGSKSCVGEAVVTLQALDARLSWVGSKYNAQVSSLRVDTGSLEEVVVKEGLVCKKENSPCYFLREHLPDSVPRCVALTAEDGQKIDQCEVYVSPFQVLTETPSLDLYDLKELRLSFPTAPPRAELVVFRLDSNDILSAGDYACLEGRARSCSQQVAIPDDLEKFGVLVVTLDEEDDVESLIVTFQVYKPQVEQLALDVFRVSLDSSNPAGDYTLKLHGEASVQCGETTPDKPLCQAFFCRVDEKDDVTIKKTEGKQSVTFSVMRGETPQRSHIRSVTSLSQSPEGEIRVRVASSGGVEKAEYVNFVSDVATTGEGHDLVNTTSEYTVDVPSRGAGSWDFVVLGFAENGTLVEVGQAYVDVQALDAEVDEVWMDDTSTSFRLDTGTQQEVVLQGAGTCKDTESPCYFLEVPKEPVVREHCIDITNNAEGEGERSSVMKQCGDATGNYSSLPGEVSLTLEGSDKMVVKGDFAGNTAVEITVYDSATPSDILSEGETSCEEEEEEGRICSQGFRAPKDSRSLKVLVVALASEGGVEGTLLLEYDYQTTGTAVWVIVVSVLVSLLVVALVGFGIGYIVKKKKKEKKQEITSSDSEGRYQNSLL